MRWLLTGILASTLPIGGVLVLGVALAHRLPPAWAFPVGFASGIMAVHLSLALQKELL